MNDSAMECAYKRCDCHVTRGAAVRRGERLYCSELCADGRGCPHKDCNCGQFPAEERLRP
jgi:hypothetical protein